MNFSVLMETWRLGETHTVSYKVNVVGLCTLGNHAEK